MSKSFKNIKIYYEGINDFNTFMKQFRWKRIISETSFHD